MHYVSLPPFHTVRTSERQHILGLCLNLINNKTNLTQRWGVRFVLFPSIPHDDSEGGARGVGDFCYLVEREVERRRTEGFVGGIIPTHLAYRVLIIWLALGYLHCCHG